jgi:hypothetical protein
VLFLAAWSHLGAARVSISFRLADSSGLDCRAKDRGERENYRHFFDSRRRSPVLSTNRTDSGAPKVIQPVWRIETCEWKFFVQETYQMKTSLESIH